MEFSILIPVYNTHIHELSQALYAQASKLSDTFEILFIDDCSTLSITYINQKEKSTPNVRYEVLTNNIGRAAIRNMLFDKATYENCIIMDGDVSIIKNNFVETYLQELKDGQVLVGGHVYQKEAPISNAKRLHWLYGTQIESKSLEERLKQPYHSFMTSNFACKKSTFQQCKFDESVQGYGHEDTLFGLALKKNNIQIVHLDNPVQHDGIDKSEDFLVKQKNAVLNLKKLYTESNYKSELRQQSKLIKLATSPLPFFVLKVLRKSIEQNLLSANPSLKKLQIQKLLWWHYG